MAGRIVGNIEIAGTLKVGGVAFDPGSTLQEIASLQQDILGLQARLDDLQAQVAQIAAKG
jgi:hypothetical protein